jgi:hypothetical protein
MKLAHWHRSQGDSVTFTRGRSAEMFEPEYDRVYGSAIFGFSKRSPARRIPGQWPDAIVGGTGTDELNRRADGSASRIRALRLLDLSRLRRLHRLHAAGVPVALRLLRGAEEGGQAAR